MIISFHVKVIRGYLGKVDHSEFIGSNPAGDILIGSFGTTFHLFSIFPKNNTNAWM